MDRLSARSRPPLGRFEAGRGAGTPGVTVCEAELTGFEKAGRRRTTSGSGPASARRGLSGGEPFQGTAVSIVTVAVLSVMSHRQNALVAPPAFDVATMLASWGLNTIPSFGIALSIHFCIASVISNASVAGFSTQPVLVAGIVGLSRHCWPPDC